MRYVIMLSIVAICLSGCANIFKPKPYGMLMEMPGPPDYSNGWRDGCISGTAATSGTYYKTFYRFQQDPSMTTNKMYYQAWKNAFSYCNNYLLKWDHVPFDEPENTDPIK